ncbi:TPA: hypothetical protein ACSP1Y_003498 [Aeromonas hydrophila]|uniref:hypothetical protein n=1 Tax=Aeromonas hydrophila TaxID=644 RepID=UPI0022AE73C4|nr:hypothetical protein [Aeromonas hydrophila]MCZ4333343.1 hypothetical protein [Aeromonas hydrophila]
MIKNTPDIFNLLDEVASIYKKTGSRNLLKLYGKNWYFHLSFAFYIMISAPNIILSLMQLFGSGASQINQKYVFFISTIVTLLAVLIIRWFLSYAIQKIIKPDSCLINAKEKQLFIRYIHFKDDFEKSHNLNNIPIDTLIEWRKISSSAKDDRSILKTTWFIPLIGITLGLAPIDTKTKIDITVLCGYIIITFTLAFYMFRGTNEDENIDKFLSWIKMEKTSELVLTHGTEHYFIPSKNNSTTSPHLTVEDPAQVSSAATIQD